MSYCKNNILILSASRKTVLCHWFLKAATKFGIGVLGTDINPNAKALSLLDGFVRLPRLNSPDFLNDLLSTIDKNNIKLIVPTREEELIHFSGIIDTLEKSACFVLCNRPEITKTLIDKGEFTNYCISELGFYNLHIVKSPFEARDDHFPLFFRGAKKGSSLKIRISNKEELQAAFRLFNNGIATTYLEGQEISVDTYVSREGRIVYIVPRSRDLVLGGESLVTTTIDSLSCENVTKQFLQKSGIKGPSVLQGMVNGDVFTPFEINLRFGGASSLSFEAAYSGPELVLREYVLGEELTETYKHELHLELFKDFKEIFTSNLHD